MGVNHQATKDSAVFMVAGIPEVAQTFPVQYEPWIDRRARVNESLEVFETDIRLLLLTGFPGVGKSVFAAKICQMLPSDCIGLFLAPISYSGPQIAQIRHDIYCQAHWIINSVLPEYCPVNESALSEKLCQLQRYIRGKRKPFYIIIDGLNHFSEKKGHQPDSYNPVSEVLGWFEPFVNLFRFILTISPECLPQGYRTLDYNTVMVPRFDKEETYTFLGEISDEEIKRQIWQLTHGHPSALSSIRRILKRDPLVTIDSLPTQLPELFSFEWNQVDEQNSNQLLILAALSLFPKRFTSDTLKSVLKIPDPEIRYALSSFGFLIQSEHTSHILFTTEALQTFISKKLKKFESIISEQILSGLMEQPESPEAIQELPTFLYNLGHKNELLEFLTPSHLEQTLQQSQSWSQTVERTSLGLKVALDKGDIHEETRFALHKSSLLHLKDSNPGRSTTEALLAMGRYEDAIGVADSQLAKEKRLLLLAIIANYARKHKAIAPSAVADNIHKLAAEFPKGVEAEARIEVATELLQTFPDLAIRLVESSSDTDRNIDSALASVSIRAFASNQKNKSVEETIADISLKVGSEKARRFTVAAQLLFSGGNAGEILTQIKKIQQPQDQIYLLRQWTSSHPKSSDCSKVMEYALDLIVATSDFAPNSRVLRELATPLPSLEKNYSVLVLVSRFAEQLKLLKDRGLTEDYVHLQLILGHTEAMYAEETYTVRLNELYAFISKIEDLSISAACFALMCMETNKIDRNPEVAVKCGFFETLKQELLDSFQRLLDSTADHYVATRAIIKRVHLFSPLDAFDLANRLNTEPRRDYALSDLITYEFQQDNPSPEFLKRCLSCISSLEFGERTFVDGFLSITSEEVKLKEPRLFEFLLLQSRSIRGSVKRTRAIAKVIAVYSGCEELLSGQTFTELASELKSSWESIDDLTIRREVGLQLVVALHEKRELMAIDYWNMTNALQSSAGLNDIDISEAIFHNTSLAIRYFKGLIPRGLASIGDQQRILEQINRLPSLSKRCLLLSELAISYLRNKKTAESLDIVNVYIEPVLEQILQKDRVLYERVFSKIAAAMYISSPASTRRRLSSLQPYRRDAAFWSIVSFIFTKTPSSDPFEVNERHDYKLADAEVSDLIEILRIIDNDSLFYSIVSGIADTLSTSRGKRLFSLNQLADYAAHISKIINEKLPNPRFIKHQGYAVIARAELWRFSVLKEEQLDTVLSDARKIVNIADRAFVLAIVATTLPAWRKSLSRELLNDALKLVAQISTYEDKVERYKNISQFASQVDRSICRAALREASDFVGSIESWRGGAYAREPLIN